MDAGCAKCGQPIRSGDPDNLEEAIGFTKDRPRGTGGLHHLRFWRKTGRIMCGRCVRAQAGSGHPFQESFL